MVRSSSLNARSRAMDAASQVRDLQPVLLERLTDDDVGQTREPDGAFLLTRAMLRESVLRELRWLLNTVHLEATADLEPYPCARQSVINYGIGALAGRLSAELEWTDIERGIREALIQFEPRILAESLNVRCLTEGPVHGQQNILSLEISGDLWCMPYPIEFIFRTEVDLECGYFAVRVPGGG